MKVVLSMVFIYKLFAGYIADYKDSVLTADEYSEHIKVLGEIDSGNYVILDELPG